MELGEEVHIYQQNSHPQLENFPLLNLETDGKQNSPEFNDYIVYCDIYCTVQTSLGERWAGGRPAAEDVFAQLSPPSPHLTPPRNQRHIVRPYHVVDYCSTA